jgi:hypothetical protein
MKTLRALALALLLEPLAYLASCAPAAADIYATNQALCEQFATTHATRSVDDFRTMTEACAVAANGHQQRADSATGAARQRELILEATYLYFAAEGEVGSNRSDLGVAALEKSRAIYQDVLDHAATPELKQKAQLGLNVVARTLNPSSATK